jgi:hypothetical protein
MAGPVAGCQRTPLYGAPTGYLKKRIKSTDAWRRGRCAPGFFGPVVSPRTPDSGVRKFRLGPGHDTRTRTRTTDWDLRTCQGSASKWRYSGCQSIGTANRSGGELFAM